MPRLHALLLGAACLAASATVACHHPSVGSTCKVDADCGSGLECEIENGKGTCQEHHDDTEDHANDDAGDGVDDATNHESTAHGGGTAEDTEHGGGTAEDTEHGGGSDSNSG